MKDRQSASLPPAQQIPVISPVLHYFAMPALVFWRQGFGYAYLRPKSIFLASAIASGLLGYVVFHESRLKPFGSVAAFTWLVSILYVIHLCRSVSSELARSAEHDQFSGVSHLLQFWPKTQRLQQEKFVHMVAEPALTVLFGMIASFLGKEWLGWFLSLSGVTLCLKEAINGWLTLRRRKAFDDQIGDIGEEMPEPTPQREPAAANSAFRKPRQKRVRKVASDQAIDTEEFRHAQVLRMMPPYSLEAATKNYRMLIQHVHPDHQSGETDTHDFAVELNAAMEYFRVRFTAEKDQ